MEIREADIRAFEDEYYASRPPVVLDAIGARDEGWRMAKTGDIDGGLRVATGSKDLLMCYGIDSEDNRFSREYFASVARIAQIYAIAGNYTLASYNALCAVRRTPEAHTVALDDEFAFEYRPDQYSIIFGGSLALILSTSNWHDDRVLGKGVAARARVDARWSEDPENVIFTDREMKPEQRTATQSKFEKIAIAANLAYLLPPVPAVREGFAGRVLRKAARTS